MASCVKKTVLSFLLQNRNLLHNGVFEKATHLGMVRSQHILHKEDKEAKIVMADDGATIVCWHPEPKFPYECSLPLPVQSMDMTKVLKDNSQDLVVFNVEKPQLQREYLMKMTATTKHRWFPRLGIKYAKKTKRDREFL